MNFKSLLIKSFALVATVLIFVIALKTFNFSTTKEKFSEKDIELQSSVINAFSLPDSLTLGGDYVPLENIDVRESLDNELLSVGNFHSQTFKNMKRAARFFPTIELILEKNGIPNDFKFLAVAESNLDNLSSPAGAHGFWQFLKSTGAEYGLEINSEVDERYHLEKATQAACEYLGRAYKVYSDWALVAASYNYGRGNVNSQLKRQKVDSYYDMHLNKETGRYVYRILAIKLIFSNPEQYNLHIDKNDFYSEYKTKEIEVNTSIPSLIDFALEHNTNYKIVKILNPWLRSDKLTNAKKKTYFIKVPFESGRKWK